MLFYLCLRGWVVLRGGSLNNALYSHRVWVVGQGQGSLFGSGAIPFSPGPLGEGIQVALSQRAKYPQLFLRGTLGPV